MREGFMTFSKETDGNCYGGRKATLELGERTWPKGCDGRDVWNV